MHEDHIGFLLKQVTDKLQTRADAQMKSWQITLSQSRVLGYLDQHGGQATQRDLEVALSVSHPTVVGLVSRLEQNGFVICWQDLADRRNKLVALTDKAKTMGTELAADVSRQEAYMLRGLSPEEIAALKYALKTIYQNLD